MKKLSFLAIASCVVVWGCQGAGEQATPEGAPKAMPKPNTTTSTPTATDTVTFAQVNEIMTANCVGCHGDTDPKAGVSFTSHEKIMAKVTSGDPANSKIVRVMRGSDGKVMPPSPNSPLSEDKIKMVEAWIQAGAKA